MTHTEIAAKAREVATNWVLHPKSIKNLTEEIAAFGQSIADEARAEERKRLERLIEDADSFRPLYEKAESEIAECKRQWENCESILSETRGVSHQWESTARKAESDLAEARKRLGEAHRIAEEHWDGNAKGPVYEICCAISDLLAQQEAPK